MSKNPHTEEFDRALQEMMHGAETPVPPGLWEGVAGGIGAQTTAAVVSGISKILVLKLAAGVAGLSLISVLTYQLLKPADSTKSDPGSEAIEWVEGDRTKSSEKSGSELPDSDVSDDTEIEQVEPIQKAPVEEGGNSVRSESPISGVETGSVPNAPAEVKSVDNTLVQPTARLQLSNETPCPGERIQVRLEADPLNVTSIRWFVNTKLLPQTGLAHTFSFEKGINHIQVRFIQNGQEYSRDARIAVRELKAGFSHQVEPGALLLNSTVVGTSTWFINGLQIAENTRSVRYSCRNNETYRVMQIAAWQGCTDTAIEDVPVQWTEELVKETPELVIPNVFSPYEEDGKNDRFEIRLGQEVEEFHIQIVDARGNTVFESTNPLDFWNGRMMNQGELAPEGWYHYFLYFKLNGGEESKVGKVLLVK